MVFSMSQIWHFLGVVKFWLFFPYFMGNFGVKIFQVFRNSLKLFLPDRTGIWHVKNQIFFIIYACSLNKTTKTINELTNEQPRSHFFLTDPLFLLLVLLSWCWKTVVYCIMNSFIHVEKVFVISLLESTYFKVVPLLVVQIWYWQIWQK